MTLNCSCYVCPNYSKPLGICFMANSPLETVPYVVEAPASTMLLIPVCKTGLLAMGWKLEYITELKAYRRIKVE